MGGAAAGGTATGGETGSGCMGIGIGKGGMEAIGMGIGMGKGGMEAIGIGVLDGGRTETIGLGSGGTGVAGAIGEPLGGEPKLPEEIGPDPVGLAPPGRPVVPPGAVAAPRPIASTPTTRALGVAKSTLTAELVNTADLFPA